MIDAKNLPVKRTRVGKPKVKTGCTTCKYVVLESELPYRRAATNGSWAQIGLGALNVMRPSRLAKDAPVRAENVTAMR
jgi:hypothetical protein